MEQVDITVVGAGVVGLAVARRLAERGRAAVLLEKNPRHGQETSSRNSEVIHAGIYYPDGSLKARLCVSGREMIYAYCAERNIPCRRCGKIIVVPPENEDKLRPLYEKGLRNGVTDLKLISSKETAALEPGIVPGPAILSPSTGIFSTDLFMDSLLKEAEAQELMPFMSTELTAVEPQKGGYVLKTSSQEPFFSRLVINCAGHGAPAVAAMAGMDIDAAGYRQRMVKGEYFRIRSRHSITRLVYSLPTEISLGIHLTPDMQGRVRVGPSAVPCDRLDYSVEEADKKEFFAAARHFFPDITEDDMYPDTAGIRPKLAVHSGDMGDFIIRNESERGLPGFVNLIGIDSPGLTSSLAIADEVAAAVKDML